MSGRRTGLDFKSALRAVKERLLGSGGRAAKADASASPTLRIQPALDIKAPGQTITVPRAEERQQPPSPAASNVVPPAATGPAAATASATRRHVPSATRFSRGRPPKLDPEDIGWERSYTGPAKLESTDPADLKGDKALEYVRARVGAREISVDSGPPERIGGDASSEIDRCIDAGSAILRATPTPDEAGFIVGFDFGTSSTKVVIHQRGAGDPAYALPVPLELQARDGGPSQDHLWRSTVWFEPSTQTFALAPTGSAVAIEGFKTGLIQSNGNRMRVAGVTHAQATTAYLALLIAYVLGHHRLDSPRGFDRKAQFARFHFGVPVACIDEPGCVVEFRRALEAAFSLVPVAHHLTHDLVRTTLAAGRPDNRPSGETPYLVFEELAAVIAGYRASPDARIGPHMVVDVGAATLDVATFYIPEGDNQVPVYMTGVELLGAEALNAARTASVPEPTFRAACYTHTQHVLSHTFQKKNASFFPMNGVPKPLLFVGGGRLTDMHKALYARFGEGLEAPIQTPRPGRNLRCDDQTDFARLLLAWGLSQDEAELPQIRPPSQVEAELRRERDWGAAFIDKDMV